MTGRGGETVMLPVSAPPVPVTEIIGPVKGRMTVSACFRLGMRLAMEGLDEAEGVDRA